MKTYDLTKVTPFVAIHPGEILKDELQARNMQQKQLAELCDIQTSILNDIIKGKRNITAEQSVLIGNALDIEDGFFYNLQMEYDLDVARITDRVTEQKAAAQIWKILQEFISIKFLKTVGLMSFDIKTTINNIFEMCGVSSVDEFLKKRSSVQEAFYKKTDKYTLDDNDLFTWVCYCKYKSRQDYLNIPFDKAKVSDLCNELNSIFYENHNVIQRCTEKCNEYGIKFYVVKKIGKVPVDGMSFIEGENPTIILTLRKDTIDNFAFSFMHEIGHISKHIGCTSKTEFINKQDLDQLNEYEIEANNFANEILIPNSSWRKLMALKSSLYKIQQTCTNWAESQNINRWIVLGRYSFETGMYKFKSDESRKVN